jgi:hypothetical protein
MARVAGYARAAGSDVTERIPDSATVDSYGRLSAYYAETLEQASCFHLSAELTNLALRTVMPKYRLTLDMLPKNKPWGFMTWGLPIGQAENAPSMNTYLNFRTGEMEEPDDLPAFSPYEEGDYPIVGASWRYEPEANIVWVGFYTHAPRKSGSRFDAFSMEREQALPLDQTLNWADSDSTEGPRLQVTALNNPDERPKHLRQTLLQVNEAARSVVSDLVRTLIASWMITKWKIANREIVPPPQDIVRSVSKATGKPKSKVAEEKGTTVFRLGAPIRQRASRAGDKEYTWSHRTIVGPVVRTRQYIPALDIYDEEPRFIEPYIAGPPDAPIRNIDKVFLLGD